MYESYPNYRLLMIRPGDVLRKLRWWSTPNFVPIGGPEPPHRTWWSQIATSFDGTPNEVRWVSFFSNLRLVGRWGYSPIGLMKFLPDWEKPFVQTKNLTPFDATSNELRRGSYSMSPVWGWERRFLPNGLLKFFPEWEISLRFLWGGL